MVIGLKSFGGNFAYAAFTDFLGNNVSRKESFRVFFCSVLHMEAIQLLNHAVGIMQLVVYDCVVKTFEHHLLLSRETKMMLKCGLLESR